MSLAGFGILHNRKVIFQAQLVTGPAQGKAGAEEIPVLMLLDLYYKSGHEK